MRPRIGLALALALAAHGARAEDAAGTDKEPPGETGGLADALTVPVALKSSLLVSRAPDDPLLFPERDAAASLWRLRISPELKLGELVNVEAAYEHRLRNAAQGSPIGLAVLPPEVPAPYRLAQLDWEIVSSPSYVWHHEIDRLAVSLHSDRVEVTAGRQAIGWGRGVLFSAVDLFAPFSALEADREWRRGVDALRGEVSLADTASVDAVAALGPTIDESVFAGRLRGYRGNVDAEVVAGWRARDVVVGATSSAAIGDAEVHGELAIFRTPEPLAAGGQLGDQLAIKGVLGGSYRIALGSGVPVFVEYHYSGFGAAHASDLIELLANPSFRTRLERGDMQILGRHAISIQASYEVSAELTAGLLGIASPVDGSGVIVPNATATLGDRLAIRAMIYVPWGAEPVDLTLQSEYGSAALSGFLQLVATY